MTAAPGKGLSLADRYRDQQRYRKKTVTIRCDYRDHHRYSDQHRYRDQRRYRKKAETIRATKSYRAQSLIQRPAQLQQG